LLFPPAAVESDAFGLRPRNDSPQRVFVPKEIKRVTP